jgi:hypothetical protein
LPYTSQYDPAPLDHFAGDWPTHLQVGDQVIEAAGVHIPKELDFILHPQGTVALFNPLRRRV